MKGGNLSQRRLAALAGTLGPTDRAVIASLRRVRVATGGQLVRLHFADRPSAARQARRHLARLVGDRVLCRLHRRIGGVRSGSSGYVYALDVAGQRLAASSRPNPPRRPWTPGLPFLAHALAVTEIYVGLSEAARHGELDVLHFATEPDCWRRVVGPGGVPLSLKPDAFVRLGVGPYEDRWFIEVDRATEAPSTLTRKTDLYRRFWQSGHEQSRSGVFPKVLWVVPDNDRKSMVVDVLGRQPAEAWPLFQVVTERATLGVLRGGRP